MSDNCIRTFEEELLSGYLDGELTQADEQRVRLHLEECEVCSTAVATMAAIREATMTTSFQAVDDEQWMEKPRSAASRWMRRSGWLLTGGWLLGFAVVGFREFFLAPESWAEKAIPVVLGLGILLLLGSVGLDRIRAAKSDRYRRVKK